jgi:hypothetical protein
MPFSGKQIRRARGQVESVVYWVHANGELMLAPHTDLHPFPGYRREEASTLRDIERLSKALRLQEESKMRGMKIEEHLRAQKKWDDQEARIKLHRASGYKSENDKIVCERILKSIERRRQTLYQLLLGSPGEFLTGCFQQEKRESPTGFAQYNQKSKALA